MDAPHGCSKFIKKYMLSVKEGFIIFVMYNLIRYTEEQSIMFKELMYIYLHMASND